MAFAIANDELALLAEDIVNGQREAFAQAQSAAVDELDRRAITPQANRAQEIMHLLTREDGGKEVVILCADLGEDAPQGALEQLTPKTGEYAFGWGLAKMDWTPKPVITHNGSNSLNLAMILLTDTILASSWRLTSRARRPIRRCLKWPKRSTANTDRDRRCLEQERTPDLTAAVTDQGQVQSSTLSFSRRAFNCARRHENVAVDIAVIALCIRVMQTHAKRRSAGTVTTDGVFRGPS